MQSTRFLTTYLQMCRYISSTSTNLNLSREGKFIKKLLHGTKKSKRLWYDTSKDLRNSMDIINPNNKPLSVHTVRRMTIRNKLFMEHITDLISMGGISDISNNIEITHVNISPDFKYVNVFWIHSDNNACTTSVSKEALQQCAKIIRHELSQLRVIGVVPPIQFVQNKQFSMQKEVENKLATLNIEEDCESLSYSEQMQLIASHISTADHTVNTEPDPNLNVPNSEVDEFYVELPAMRHDVLGLDHHKIMSRIATSLSTAKKAVQRRTLDTSTSTDDSPHDLVPNKTADFLTKQEQQSIFSDFLIKRRIEEKRRYHLRKKGHKQEMFNDYEKEINPDCENDNNNIYSDEVGDEHSDEFEEKT